MELARLQDSVNLLDEGGPKTKQNLEMGGEGRGST